jgi:hypothetical protein
MQGMAAFFQAGQHAYGIIAVGQVATGVIAIGQIATGVIAIGQVARGVIAIGMGALGLVAFGMGAAGVLYSGGMVAIGGRAGVGLLALSLIPRPPARLRSPLWWMQIGLGLLLLSGMAWVFWWLAGVPLGNALWGPDGLLR